MGEKAECLNKQQKDENNRIFLFNLAVRNAAIDVTQTVSHKGKDSQVKLLF